MILALLLSSSTATAGPERLTPPGSSLAAEEGVSAAWVNPANLGFNPGAGLGMYYRQGLTDGDAAFAASTAAGGTALGMLYAYDAETGSPWWGFNSALSLGLPGSLRVGTNITWSLPEGAENNFVSWDFGLGYRPLPWFGAGATFRNLGNPAPSLGVTSVYALGAVLRPLGDAIELGVDYEGVETAATDGEPTAIESAYAGVLRARPAEGLEVRVRGDTLGRFTAGLTVFFGGAGVGGYYDDALLDPADGGAASAPALVGFLGTDSSDERLFGLGSRVPVIELAGSFPYQPVATLFSAPQESYLHLLERLTKAGEDRSVKAVVLRLDGARFSSAQIEELRAVVEDIQTGGKPVIAYLHGSASNGAYWLASACDHIYLHPAGGLDLVGVSAELMYFRGALDLVGVEPQFAKRAEYKGSPEQFTNTAPSDPAREQMDALLDDLYGAMLQGVSAGREIAEEELRHIIDEGPFSPEEALAAGLIDGLYYPDELEETVSELLETGFRVEDNYGQLPEYSGWASGRAVALVYVAGPISGGESSTPGLFSGVSAGSKTIERALIQAGEIDAIKAVVLRVDSPGGSAFASDEIWRAVEKLTESGKPVIVSMGGVAASGGYYVASGATAIYADPSTITGSIGVYSGKFSFGELYEKVGVSNELIVRGRNASMYSNSKPMDPVEFAAMDRLVQHTYDQFKGRVSEGRGLDLDAVEEVARGRVWSGTRAAEVGLVDELGGLQDAIARARLEADIPERAEVTLLTVRGVETAFGDPVLDKVQALFKPTLADDLPEAMAGTPLDRWRAYLPLADETMFMMLPWSIEIQ